MNNKQQTLRSHLVLIDARDPSPVLLFLDLSTESVALIKVSVSKDCNFCKVWRFFLKFKMCIQMLVKQFNEFGDFCEVE